MMAHHSDENTFNVAPLPMMLKKAIYGSPEIQDITFQDL